MTKVLYMLPAEKFGGAERQGTIAIKKLPQIGVEVLPVVGPGQMIIEALERNDIKDYIHTLAFPDDPKHPLTFAENIQRAFYNLKCFIKSKKLIEEILRKNPCDIIYATRTFSWIIAGFVSKEMNIPVVWRCGSLITNPFQRSITQGFIGWSHPKALVSNSNAMKASFGKGLNLPSYVIQSSVDTDRFKPDIDGSQFYSRYNLSKDYKYIGISARPAPEKGPDFLASIMKKVIAANNKVKLLWAGESSWRKHLEGIFSKANLSESVTFLGHVPDIENFYSACDAVLLSSKLNSIESSPSALLEPMAMGKAVVATQAGGIPEIISDGENGFIRKYGDSKGFADAILELIENPDLALKIGKNAIAHIDNFHNELANTEALAKVCM